MAKKDSNVDVRQCFQSLMFSIIAGATALIVYFTGVKLENAQATIANTLGVFLTPEITQILQTVYNYTLLAFYGILAFNIVFSIFLILTRSRFIRGIARIISYFAGIAMFFIFIVSLVYILSFVLHCALGQNQTAILQTVYDTGVFVYLAVAFFSVMLINRQKRWFTKLF
ncbi:MAG: hypothetical protein IJZ26_04015 [Clostridia bacterium]|nr:hypothetical protein [Clostridia bacterium]